jgi:hypothetical protein
MPVVLPNLVFANRDSMRTDETITISDKAASSLHVTDQGARQTGPTAHRPACAPPPSPSESRIDLAISQDCDMAVAQMGPSQSLAQMFM